MRVAVPAPSLLLPSPWSDLVRLPAGAPGSSDRWFTSHFPLGAGRWEEHLTSPLFRGNPGRLSCLIWIYRVLQIKTAPLTFTFPEEERGTLTLPSRVPGCAVPSPRLSSQKYLQRLCSAQMPGPSSEDCCWGLEFGTGTL